MGKGSNINKNIKKIVFNLRIMKQIYKIIFLNLIHFSFVIASDAPFLQNIPPNDCSVDSPNDHSLERLYDQNCDWSNPKNYKPSYEPINKPINPLLLDRIENLYALQCRTDSKLCGIKAKYYEEKS